MPSRTIRLDAEVDERLQAHKRPDETLSEAVEGALAGRLLLYFVGLWSADAVERVTATPKAVDTDATAVDVVPPASAHEALKAANGLL